MRGAPCGSGARGGEALEESAELGLRDIAQHRAHAGEKMTIEIETTTRGAAVVLGVRGEIDISTVPQLLQALAEQERQARQALVLDLTAVSFLDSSGLGALVGVQKEVAAAGGRLTVVCSDPKVLRIFSITRLTEVIDIVPTVDDAVASLTD
jgi:anti-sigma B factor antagonist